MLASELRKGSLLSGNSVGRSHDSIFRVEDFGTGKAGKGGGFVQCKLKDIMTGNAFTHKLMTDTRVEVVELDPPQSFTVLYEDDGIIYLMESETFEQVEVPLAVVGDQAEWLQDGMVLTLQAYEGVPLSAKLPDRIALEVIEAPKSTRSGKSGDTHKTVRLENGSRIRAPHFVEVGERVLVNTTDGTYAGKAS